MHKNDKTKISRSENMSRIRSTNTVIEIMLRKALWAQGLRYRINDKTVYGKPDIVFKAKKVAIFCDSEFWHGKHYIEKKYTIKTNSDYWISKLERNIKRDKEVNQVLQSQGWIILRFWAKDINKNLPAVIEKIQSVLK